MDEMGAARLKGAGLPQKELHGRTKEIQAIEIAIF
jgi:hypothetical protein